MLTLQFVPYSEIEHLDSQDRIDKILDVVRGKKIVLMQGRLKPQEETMLITQTMQSIEKDFKGIELCTIYPEERDLQFFNRVKKEMVKALIGHRDGVTIIGPSDVVKEIRRDPNKIELFTIPQAPKTTRKKMSRKTARRATTKKTRRR